MLPAFPAWQELAQAPGQVPQVYSHPPLTEACLCPDSDWLRSLLAAIHPFWVMQALQGSRGMLVLMGRAGTGAGKVVTILPTSRPACSSTGLGLLQKEGFPAPCPAARFVVAEVAQQNALCQHRKLFLRGIWLSGACKAGTRAHLQPPGVILMPLSAGKHFILSCYLLPCSAFLPEPPPLQQASQWLGHREASTAGAKSLLYHSA